MKPEHLHNFNDEAPTSSKQSGKEKKSRKQHTHTNKQPEAA